MDTSRFTKVAALTLLLGLISSQNFAQVGSAGRVCSYSLLPGSYLIDDCPPCARPTILEPMRGTFDLRLIEENPLFSRYALDHVSFTAGFIAGRTYRVVGKGTYRAGSEVGFLQDLFLEVRIDDGFTNRLCYLTNATPAVERLWPMIETTVMQTNGTFTQVYHLHLFAAPLREIWFSTTHGFHPGVQPLYTNYVSPGNLISSAGRVVKRNSELTASLGIMPSVPDVGLDAVDVLPGGETAFSMEQDIFSETLGPLHQGDVLSDRGRVVRSYVELIGAFGPEPPPADEGVDAVQVMSTDELYFSVENDFFSETLGRAIRKGDLLSSRGVVIKTNEQLIARFNPVFPKEDCGLDGIYVWPNGEVWFSVETGFYGQHFEFYAPGDLLSDQGYVVYRNLDLLAAFQPLEELADFGLDALFIVTDTLPPTPAPRFLEIKAHRPSGEVTLRWEGSGRLFQLEGAAKVTGPYLPLTPITTETSFEDAGALAHHLQYFYRLRQW
jgi:hypothetical protein